METTRLDQYSMTFSSFFACYQRLNVVVMLSPAKVPAVCWYFLHVSWLTFIRMSSVISRWLEGRWTDGQY